MRTLLRRVKDCLPPASRTRIRQLLAGAPLVDRLAGLQWCPWKVHFVVGGAMKGGTTALSAFLDQHPEIRMASGKEAHFFDSDEYFPPGDQPEYDRYLRQFSPSPTTRLLGDATPVYLYWNSAPARIAVYNPRMKWVVLLRHPVERAYSHWNMLRQSGEESLSFAEAVAQEPKRLAAQPRQCRKFSYLDRGFYARQLHRLFSLTPRRQVLVIRSEELRCNHQATLRRVFEFLGVDAGVRIEPAMIHARNYETALPAEVRRELTACFADDLRDLERLLGWNLSDWWTV